MMSTDAAPDRSSRRDTPAVLKVMPSGAVSRPGSDRTWDSFHGITFASSHESTPSQSASHLIHGPLSQGTSSQIWSEPPTQQRIESRDEHRDGCENIVSTKSTMHMLQTQLGCATKSPGSNDDGHSPESARFERCPPSNDETFRSPLGFHIPEVKLRNALLAEPTSTASYWHYTLYQGPGGDKDKVKVHYCKNKENTEKIAQLFLDEKVIGFDIEWTPNSSATDGITKNVALIQIASEERVLLAHIARYPNAATSEKAQQIEDFVAPSLKEIMESSSISKVGVAIKADCTRLRKFLRIDSHGLFELSHLYKLVKFSSGNVKKISKTLVSLKQQVQEHLQLPLDKGDVRTSDWSNSQDLTYQQTQYAASDSYAALQLYYILEAKRRALEPTPPRPAHAELNLPIRLANGQRVESFDEASESIEEGSTDAASNTFFFLEDDFQKLAIEESASLYPQLPASSVSSSSSIPSLDSRPPPSSKSLSAIPSKEELAPEIVEANASVTEYIEARPTAIKMKPNKAHLRAYYLWEKNSMESNVIAALLRVELSTVAVYILQAIKVEHFRFGEKRARMLVPLAPKALRDDFETMISTRIRKSNDDAKEKGQ